MSNYLIAALYHFVALPDFRELRVKLDELCRAVYENESDDAFSFLIQGILADDDDE